MTKIYGGREVRQLLTYFFAVVGVGFATYLGIVTLFGDQAVPNALAQSEAYLSRRIDQAEQRFFGIESRVTRLEQQRPPAVTQPLMNNSNETELQLLRTQVDSLRSRLGEVECALLRLDERTLTSTARSARNRVNPKVSDICRQEFGIPIQLTARP